MIATEFKTLKALTIDWSAWDDTWHYIAGRKGNYYQENLAGGYLATFGFDFVLLLNTAGEIVWAEAYRTDNDKTLPIETLFPQGISPDSPMLAPIGYNQAISGFLNTAAGPGIFVSTGILKSNGNGPRNGHMITGKLLDKMNLAIIGDQLITEIDFVPLTSQEISNNQQTIVVGQDRVSATAPVRDISNELLGYLRVTEPREIKPLVDNTLKLSIGLLMISAIVVMICLWFLMKNLMLAPIEKLTLLMREARDDRHARKKLGQVAEVLNHWKRDKDSNQPGDEIDQLVSAFDSLTLSLHKATSQIWDIAHTDGLTELPNRRLYVQILERQVEEAQAKKEQFVVMFLDLDDFKVVNDSLGHEAGDQLLQKVASRIKSLLQISEFSQSETEYLQHDILARLGGDEFVIILYGDDPVERSSEIASQIVSVVCEPFTLDGQQVTVGASIGLVVFPEDGDSVDALLRHADTAMYETKKSGKGAWRRYSNKNDKSTAPHKLQIVRSEDR